MTGFLHSSHFSQSEEMTSLEKKYGLPGYARLLKLYEALASLQPLELHWPEVEELLSGKQEMLSGFLAFVSGLGLADVTINSEGITATHPLPVSQSSDSIHTVFTSADQWADWLEYELCYFRRDLEKPANQSTLRHFVASNVSVQEMEQVIVEGIQEKDNVKSLHVLFSRLKVLRGEKIMEARRL